MPEHSALITALVIDRRVCRDCIGVKAALIPSAVDAYLEVMGRVLRIELMQGACDLCGQEAMVVSIDRPA